MKPNDIEIIELLLIKKLDCSIVENLKQQLFQDDEFMMLFKDMEILIAAIRISARKTALHDKISKIMAS